ncbi:MAG: Radical domain protein [Chloroflexi bacterium]|nr:Radical domain protein [Chloroflexota bacterium]
MPDARLLYAEPDGTLLEHPRLRPAGLSFNALAREPLWLPLPAGATLCQLPGCTAQGIDAQGKVRKMRPGMDLAVGALLPTGYARQLLPAYEKVPGTAHLPLFGYTAVAAVDGEICAAYTPIDAPGSWDPASYNTEALRGLVGARLAAAPDDPLLAQLGVCALDYGCYTAQNIFYERWEGALPASPTCSAQCVGCISEQLGEVPSPQIRLSVAPSAEQLADLAVAHLNGGPNRIISFGQGCEGDPLNRWRALARTVRLVRDRLPADHPHGGYINMNTNGWHTRGLAEIVEAGLQRIRVSLFSAIDEHYSAYYKPRGYSFADVRRSIRLCSDAGVWVALNLLTFPGYTDCEGEMDALLELIATEGVHEVQVRTLNIDREMLRESVPEPCGRERGIPHFLDVLRASGVRVATHAWVQPDPIAVEL